MTSENLSGWIYVVFAYGLSGVSLLLYAFFVVSSLGRAQRELQVATSFTDDLKSNSLSGAIKKEDSTS